MPSQSNRAVQISHRIFFHIFFLLSLLPFTLVLTSPLEAQPVISVLAASGAALLDSGQDSTSDPASGAERPETSQEAKATPSSLPVFQQSTSWTPRGLKAAESRGDDPKAGRVLGYDGAGRLTYIARDEKATESVANNSQPNTAALAAAPDGEINTYDETQNRLSRSTLSDGIVGRQVTPPDASGRNRPGAVNEKTLEWDANGNLIRKGSMSLRYDFRNRLRKIIDGSGQEVASYEYDVFNRRVEKKVEGTVYETAWRGWQAIEDYRAGQLHRSRTFGAGLDEIVRQDVDLDGDGSPESHQVPLYDNSGNLVVLTDAQAKPIERYSYEGFGLESIRVDLGQPEVEQVRLVGDELWLEIDEEVYLEGLTRAIADGKLRLEKTSDGSAIELTASQPVQAGEQARRRQILTPSEAPAPGTEVRLTIEPGALIDHFFNTTQAIAEHVFPWQPGVIADTAPPEVALVLVRDGIVEIELTEPVDPATAAQVIQIDGQAAIWTATEDLYRLVTETPLAGGTHALDIGTAPLDLSGQGLTAAFQASLSIDTDEPRYVAYRITDPGAIATSAAMNPYGFQGHPIDQESGLVYMRNRYYAPELGRFITADPLGYVDGPSMYAFAMNSPVNYRDPLGLQAGGKATPTKRYEPQVSYHSRPKIVWHSQLHCDEEWKEKIVAGIHDAWFRLPACSGNFEEWQRLKKRFRNVTIGCYDDSAFEGGEDCAYAAGLNGIGFKEAAMDSNLCGPVGQTVIHELMHSIGKEHDVVVGRDAKGEPKLDADGSEELIRILGEFDCYKETVENIGETGVREVREAREAREREFLASSTKTQKEE